MVNNQLFFFFVIHMFPNAFYILHTIYFELQMHAKAVEPWLV